MDMERLWQDPKGTTQGEYALRILCRLCKKNRESPIEMYHENPDQQKYYCFHSGDLTDSEYKKELKV